MADCTLSGKKAWSNLNKSFQPQGRSVTSALCAFTTRTLKVHYGNTQNHLKQKYCN